MSILGTVGTSFSSAVAALEGLGVSAANIPAAVKAMFSSVNPNESDEMALCGEIMQLAGTPGAVGPLTQKLITDTGTPQAAIQLALTIPAMTSSAQIDEAVETIETIIKNGG